MLAGYCFNFVLSCNFVIGCIGLKHAIKKQFTSMMTLTRILQIFLILCGFKFTNAVSTQNASSAKALFS